MSKESSDDWEAEATRLRRLIAAASGVLVGSDAWCHGCERTLIYSGHADLCPIGALEAEAEDVNP